MRAKQLKGFPVISLSSGIMLGRVQDLAIDPAQKRVVALVVGEKGLLKGRGRNIPFAHVHSIGRDAVTIGDETEQDSREETPERALPFSFLGNSIISNSGDYIARVHDYTFSPKTGELERLLLHDFRGKDKKDREIFLLMEGVHNLGQDYVIAVSEYTDYLAEAPVEQGDTGLTGTDRERESAEAEETDKGGREDTALDLRGRIGEFLNWAEREISREGKGLAQETRERVKTYLQGKTTGYAVKDSQGDFLIRGGEEITKETVRTAEAQDRLAPLFFSVLSGEVEDSLSDIGNRISRIFRG